MKIREDNYSFDHMVAIGSGGFIPARIIKTYINRPIITVGIAYYDLDDNPKKEPNITQWLDNPQKQIEGRRILLVDEIDDTRNTIGFAIEKLLSHNPKEVAVAVLHNKKKAKRREIPQAVKRYYVGQDVEDLWICYPWESEDIWDHDNQALWTDIPGQSLQKKT